MTSKEALREILQQALFINPNNQTKEDINNKMFEYCEIVLKDLKRKEQFEKENQELKYKLYKMQPLEEENKRMFNENQKLQKELGTEKWKGIQFLEDFKKHKIAIDILKSNLYIVFNDNYNGVSFKKDKYDECDYTVLCLNLKSQYDLLKEMLKNDK